MTWDEFDELELHLTPELEAVFREHFRHRFTSQALASMNEQAVLAMAVSFMGGVAYATNFIGGNS